MITTKWLWLAVGFGLLVSSGCRSPYYADRGAALGGVTGAVAGAALGDHNGNAAGGALLGTAVGALAGAAIGDSMDAEVERRQALIEARTGRRMPGAVTNLDVMTLASSGLGDDVIINHIRSNGVAGQLTSSDIIHLHENGVSERVIDAMQSTASAQAARPPAVPYGAPVIVEERIVAPYCWDSPYYHRPPLRRRHVHPGPGVHWGFSYSR